MVLNWNKQQNKNIVDTVNYLDGVLKSLGTRKTIFCGNSMGGYAALMFGYLMGVDKIIAFSPQTTINTKWLILNNDFRWFKKC